MAPNRARAPQHAVQPANISEQAGMEGDQEAFTHHRQRSRVISCPIIVINICSFVACMRCCIAFSGLRSVALSTLDTFHFMLFACHPQQLRLVLNRHRLIFPVAETAKRSGALHTEEEQYLIRRDATPRGKLQL